MNNRFIFDILDHEGEVNEKKVLDLLQNEPSLINAQDGQGNTLLHWMIPDIGTGTIKKALELGVPFNLTNNQGKTALHIAAEYRFYDFDVIQLLIDFGIDVDHVDSMGYTALSRAVRSKLSLKEPLLHILHKKWSKNRLKYRNVFTGYCFHKGAP